MPQTTPPPSSAGCTLPMFNPGMITADPLPAPMFAGPDPLTPAGPPLNMAAPNFIPIGAQSGAMVFMPGIVPIAFAPSGSPSDRFR